MSKLKSVWRVCGQITYWVILPGIWLCLRFGKRTRVLIESEKEVLVVKPWLGNGKWCLPGGGIHRSERAVDALVREVIEETGVVLHPDSLGGAIERIYRDNILYFQYYEFHVTLPKRPKVDTRGLEITEAAWVKGKSLNRRNANYDVLVSLKSTS